MDSKQIPLIVAFVTVACNLVFALTGITTSISCTVSHGMQKALAAVTEVVEEVRDDI